MVPVTSLRSEASVGVGEFEDLFRLAKWCAQVGLKVIQILPINDTGHNNGPYSALSAFALHPIHLRLDTVPGVEAYRQEIDAARLRFESSERLAYHEVLDFKLDVLKRVYGDGLSSETATGLSAWIDENPWVHPYAAFRVLKDQHDQASWLDWPNQQAPTMADVDAVWSDNPDAARFYAWVQYLLEDQLMQATQAMEALGVYLKGDIPILMGEDSVDVWLHRDYFDMRERAGAPPDMFSREGQNWGFPVYNWPALKRDKYSWWIDRLKQADKFYHAYRIDHVLGFFRLWQIPGTADAGLLGHYKPSLGLSRADLNALGFGEARITWLSEPHISATTLLNHCGDEAERVAEAYLRQIGNQPLFRLKPEVASEKAIAALAEPEPVRTALLSWHRDRTLLEREGAFYPHWFYDETSAYATLSSEEQQRLRDTFAALEDQADGLWADHGRELLQMMLEATPMLACAEDLGAVPPCVPRVLDELGILSLYVERWARRFDVPGQPYIAPATYRAEAVATVSVHDSSTLRGWWHEEQLDRDGYALNIGWGDAVPAVMTPALVEAILQHQLDGAAKLVFFQLQDWLALDASLYLLSPDDERVNIPGTTNDFNWTYRMPVTLEHILTADTLNATASRLAQRGDRS
ncbi:MAG: 4-alpha-glucanotransferase [Bacteroidota bacterium]